MGARWIEEEEAALVVDRMLIWRDTLDDPSPTAVASGDRGLVKTLLPAAGIPVAVGVVTPAVGVVTAAVGVVAEDPGRTVK